MLYPSKHVHVFEAWNRSFIYCLWNSCWKNLWCVLVKIEHFGKTSIRYNEKSPARYLVLVCHQSFHFNHTLWSKKIYIGQLILSFSINAVFVPESINASDSSQRRDDPRADNIDFFCLFVFETGHLPWDHTKASPESYSVITHMYRFILTPLIWESGAPVPICDEGVLFWNFYKVR